MKICSRCGEPGEYYKEGDSICRECKKKYSREYGSVYRVQKSEHRKEYAKKYRENNAERLTEYYSSWYSDNGRKRDYEYVKQWHKDNPDRTKAHGALNRSVKAGLIIRPDICDSCGNERKIIAHHDDYSLPLEVKWLCYSCHKKIDHTNQ